MSFQYLLPKIAIQYKIVFKMLQKFLSRKNLFTVYVSNDKLNQNQT